eukprot:1157691-Pelagomonas_calceolata.AAC.2
MESVGPLIMPCTSVSQRSLVTCSPLRTQANGLFVLHDTPKASKQSTRRMYEQTYAPSCHDISPNLQQG